MKIFRVDDKVKAYFTLAIELVSVAKEAQMLPLRWEISGKYPLQDLNSTAHVPRLVRK